MSLHVAHLGRLRRCKDLVRFMINFDRRRDLRHALVKPKQAFQVFALLLAGR